MKKRINKNILLSIFIILLAIPAIQNSFLLIDEKPLQGAVIPALDTSLTLKSWLSARYQLIHEKYRNENFGFRNFFVRLNNQVAFSLYNVAKANGVVIGKDNVLYQKGYIDSYFGNDFAGKDTLIKQVQRIKVVQDELLKKGKYLIFVFAPGKGSVYPEYIPDSCFKQKKNTTNYDVIVKEFKKNNVQFVDFKYYFTKNKSKLPHPVFPRCGTHWSGYSATLVMDSLIKYFEKISKIDFVDFKSQGGDYSSEDMKFTDSDIGDAMNLLFPIKNWNMYYPRVVFDNKLNKTRPNFLFIGDSFTQSLYSFYPYFEVLLGDESEFWGGNNSVYWPENRYQQWIKVRELNQYDEIMKKDFIVIVCTEINLNNFSFSFIDSAYDIFKNEESILYWEKVKIKEDEIRKNSEFYDLVVKQAKERNISIEQNVTLNARFIIDNELISKSVK